MKLETVPSSTEVLMNEQEMAKAVQAFLEALGQPLDPEDAGRTPERVAKAWARELLSGYQEDPRAILTYSKAKSGGLVQVQQVRFSSVCIHHLLPFFGTADVLYLPQERLAGLSKIGRVVEALSRRLQIQERLTHEIATTLQEVLEPKGVLVRMVAEHTCMTLRGSRKEGSRMVTLEGTGIFDQPGAARTEALAMFPELGGSNG